jgi:peptidylamidoglycolate lyase
MEMINLLYFIVDLENGNLSKIKHLNRTINLFFFERYFDGYRFRNEVYGPIEEDVLIHVDTQTGQVKSRWGAKMFYMPHGLTIDHRGNFWLTDIAMHQVFMFKSNNLTHPALTVGEKFQSGSGKTQFCRPADIAVMKNGDFFVADG